MAMPMLVDECLSSSSTCGDLRTADLMMASAAFIFSAPSSFLPPADAYM